MARVMHFYGLSYKEVLELPLRTFWSFNAQIVRLRSEEQLSMIELFLLGGMGASEQAVTSIRGHLNKTMGEPISVRMKESSTSLEQTEKGIKQLRELKARMRN
jgi:hypothetical protein